MLSGIKVPGITGGKGSIQSVAKQMVTKGNTESLKTSMNVAITRCANAAISAGSGAAAFFKKGFDVIRDDLNQDKVYQKSINEHSQVLSSNRG